MTDPIVKHIQPPYYETDIVRECVRIFLAGPIQGAANWQEEAVKLLTAEWEKEKNRLNRLPGIRMPDLLIFNPRRSDDTWKYEFEKQVDWETHYLAQAADSGAILFWLAKEYEHDCARAYAQTTRFELAEWATKFDSDFVVGIEDGFPGAKYIKYRLGAVTSIYTSFQATCTAAFRKAMYGN